MNFYLNLETAIRSESVDEKEQLTLACLAHCNKNEIRVEEGFLPKSFSSPSYASKCHIVDPRKLPARKEFDSKEGLARLIHAIAHIEYSAIDLALDAVYRFTEMPLGYKQDWLEVALDEIRHYKMLNTLLEALGFCYGDFPVHCGLFDAGVKTEASVLERMAVVPRYYEASGLDVNPQIMKRLENKRKKPEVKALIDALEQIYEEEIVHVLKGDKWFKYLCQREGVESSRYYFDVLQKYHILDKHRPHLNVSARKEAGFSCPEMKRLGAKSCE